jgi:hypothetical protein
MGPASGLPDLLHDAFGAKIVEVAGSGGGRGGFRARRARFWRGWRGQLVTLWVSNCVSLLNREEKRQGGFGEAGAMFSPFNAPLPDDHTGCPFVTLSLPLAVSRYFCRRLVGLSGMVRSRMPACSNGVM